MFETLRRKLREWLEDTAHGWRTGESTIRCCNDDGEWHKVYIDEWGGTRVDPSEIFRTKRGREELESMSRLAISLGLRPASKVENIDTGNG
jgi:hypothetical protein